MIESKKSTSIQYRNPIQELNSFKDIHLISNEDKRDILSILMEAPATLSQLGEIFGKHPANIRHHLKQLEKAGLITLIKTNVVRGFVEKYYQATAKAFLINKTLLPLSRKPGRVVISGSHDPALDHLANSFKKTNDPEFFVLPIGSLDGLIALRQGQCHIVGCHLFDSVSGQYNLPYISHIFPDTQINLVTLVHRTQGLILPPGNPQNIRRLRDLIRPGVNFINRKKGSGTRIWLDQELKRIEITKQDIFGFTNEVGTHYQVAKAVFEDEATVGIGVLAAARQFGLGFVPLFEERFDLVIPAEISDEPNIAPLLETLQTRSFREAVQNLGGYTTTHTGERIYIEN